MSEEKIINEETVETVEETTTEEVVATEAVETEEVVTELPEEFYLLLSTYQQISFEQNFY